MKPPDRPGWVPVSMARVFRALSGGRLEFWRDPTRAGGHGLLLRTRNGVLYDYGAHPPHGFRLRRSWRSARHRTEDP